MARCSVKLGPNQYVEWSTIVDAPITYIQTRDEHAQYLREEYGKSYEDHIEARLARTDRNGTSWRGRDVSLEDQLECNRALPGEKHATLEEIICIFRNPRK